MSEWVSEWVINERVCRFALTNEWKYKNYSKKSSEIYPWYITRYVALELISGHSLTHSLALKSLLFYRIPSQNSVEYNKTREYWASRIHCTHLLTYSLTHSVTHSMNHSLTYSLSHSLNESLTHTITYSLIHLLFLPIAGIHHPMLVCRKIVVTATKI